VHEPVPTLHQRIVRRFGFKTTFGGYEQSGIGREFGLDGLNDYTEAKHLHVDELGTRAKKSWYDTVVPN
jgi:hypothetical protein